jgi:hypothetical protein
MANTTFSGPVRSENGFQSITKNTSTGAITTNATYGKGITGGVQQLSGAGAADTTNVITEITTAAGAAAVTLANGTAGQIKILTMVVDGGGDATITPATFANGTDITFADVNDTVVLVYANTIGWVVAANTGGVIS